MIEIGIGDVRAAGDGATPWFVIIFLEGLVA
jgi:hypothetical protein